MSIPKFTVIIPTYLRVSSLERCLLALEKQTRLPQEVIIVRRDTDFATGNFLKDYVKRLLPFIVRELQVEQPGFIPPVKVGFAAAKGDYVALIDDDVLVGPEWVATAISVFRENGPRLGAVSGAAVCHTKNYGSVYPARLHGAVRFAVIKNKDYASNRINALTEGNVIFRGEAVAGLLVEMKLNDGRIVHHGLDFGLQLIKKGWCLRYEPSINAEHLALRSADSVSEIDDMKTYITNLMIIIRKNLGLGALRWFVLYNLFVGQYFVPGILYFFIKQNRTWLFVKVARGTLISNLVALNPLP
jgi:GT2 family glycosyltransferase